MGVREVILVQDRGEPRVSMPVSTSVLLDSGAMSVPPILTSEQIDTLQAQLARMRTEAASAMYRTDAHERPYKAGRGECYQVWNLLGQAIDVLEKLRTQLYGESG